MSWQKPRSRGCGEAQKKLEACTLAHTQLVEMSGKEVARLQEALGSIQQITTTRQAESAQRQSAADAALAQARSDISALQKLVRTSDESLAASQQEKQMLITRGDQLESEKASLKGDLENATTAVGTLQGGLSRCAEASESQKSELTTGLERIAILQASVLSRTRRKKGRATCRGKRQSESLNDAKRAAETKSTRMPDETPTQ